MKAEGRRQRAEESGAMRVLQWHSRSFLRWGLLLIALAVPPVVSADETAAKVEQEPGPLASLAQMSRAMLQMGGATKQVVDAPSGKLTYFSLGEGPTVVLLHGTNDQAGLWSRAVTPLKSRYRFLILDFPGHGESEPTEGPLDLGMMVSAVGALLDHESPSAPATLVGNSMGGWVALLYALDHPERVKSLVLEDAGGLSLESNLTLVPETREEAEAVFAAAFADGKVFPDAIIDDFIRRAPTSPAARLDEDDWRSRLLDDRLADLAVPATLIWGEDDGLLPLDYARRMESLIPNAKLHVVPDCGHIPHNECPEAFTKLLEAALGSE